MISLYSFSPSSAGSKRRGSFFFATNMRTSSDCVFDTADLKI